jgi:phosphatidylserine/phosphatidylglycerophosphate/cardiolipin synthase-like enzyme
VRGAKVRIYLDASQPAGREPTKVFQDLAQTRGVEIRVKRENSALMHLKSNEIDGHLLRTGAANFSASGLKRQDNDLIVIKDAQAAAKFKHAFGAVCQWGSHCARRKQLSYRRPFPAALATRPRRAAATGGEEGEGRPPAGRRGTLASACIYCAV